MDLMAPAVLTTDLTDEDRSFHIQAPMFTQYSLEVTMMLKCGLGLHQDEVVGQAGLESLVFFGKVGSQSEPRPSPDCLDVENMYFSAQ